MKVSDVQGGGGLPAILFDTGINQSQPKTSVDLNELIGGLIRSTCPAGMVVRHDIMPRIAGNSMQLQQAFRMMVTDIVAHPPADARHFLYFKYCGAEPGSTRKKASIAVYTNSGNRMALFAALQQQRAVAYALFAANGMELVHCAGAKDDCLFLLNIAGKPDS